MMETALVLYIDKIPVIFILHMAIFYY